MHRPFSAQMDGLLERRQADDSYGKWPPCYHRNVSAANGDSRVNLGGILCASCSRRRVVNGHHHRCVCSGIRGERTRGLCSPNPHAAWYVRHCTNHSCGVIVGHTEPPPPALADVCAKYDTDHAGFVTVDKVKLIVTDLRLPVASQAAELDQLTANLNSEGLGIVFLDALEATLRPLLGMEKCRGSPCSRCA